VRAIDNPRKGLASHDTSCTAQATIVS
jgi:hypothetical protein